MHERRTTRRLAFLATLVACMVAGGRAHAAAIWPPGGWEPLTLGGGPYTDPLGDENPDATDLVGGSDGSGTFTAGFVLLSDGADQLTLRMRLDADGSGGNDVWQFLFDTDGDATDIDWVLEVRQSGSPSGRQVIFAPTVTGGPTFDDIAISSTFAWTGPLADWRRWTPVDDGSSFDGDADFFLDAAMPLSTFRSLTGLLGTQPIRVALSSSTSHTQANKDIPLGLGPTDAVGAGLGDPTTVPEPRTGALLGLGLCGLALVSPGRRARRSSAR